MEMEEMFESLRRELEKQDAQNSQDNTRGVHAKFSEGKLEFSSETINSAYAPTVTYEADRIPVNVETIYEYVDSDFTRSSAIRGSNSTYNTTTGIWG